MWVSEGLLACAVNGSVMDFWGLGVLAWLMADGTLVVVNDNPFP
jgi:hypothetical protein